MRALPRVSGKSATMSSANATTDDAIEVGQGDVGQRGGDLPGEVELRRLAERHAPRAVQQEVDVQVFLFLEPLQQQLVVAGVEVPVEVAEVVAGRVLAVVGELDAAAQLHRPPLGQERAAKHPPRDQRQVFELLQEVGIEEHGQGPGSGVGGQGSEVRDRRSGIGGRLVLQATLEGVDQAVCHAADFRSLLKEFC